MRLSCALTLNCNQWAGIGYIKGEIILIKLIVFLFTVVALATLAPNVNASQLQRDPNLRISLDSALIEYEFSDSFNQNLISNGSLAVLRLTHLDVFHIPVPYLEYRVANRFYLGVHAGIEEWGILKAGDILFEGTIKTGVNASNYFSIDGNQDVWLAVGTGIYSPIGIGTRSFNYVELRGGVDVVAKASRFGPYISATLARDIKRNLDKFPYDSSDPKHRIDVAMGLHFAFDLMN